MAAVHCAVNDRLCICKTIVLKQLLSSLVTGCSTGPGEELTIVCMPALNLASFLFEDCRNQSGRRVKLSSGLIFNAEGNTTCS